MTLPDPWSVSRWEFVRAAVATGGIAGPTACLDVGGGDPGGGEDEPVDAVAGSTLSGVPEGTTDDLPGRQHVWNAHVSHDDVGTVILLVHHVLRTMDTSSDLRPFAIRRRE